MEENEVWNSLNFKEMNSRQIKEAFEILFRIPIQFISAKKLKIWDNINFSFYSPHKIRNIYMNLFILDKLK
jgi:hypothetical protein